MAFGYGRKSKNAIHPHSFLDAADNGCIRMAVAYYFRSLIIEVHWIIFTATRHRDISTPAEWVTQRSPCKGAQTAGATAALIKPDSFLLPSTSNLFSTEVHLPRLYTRPRHCGFENIPNHAALLFSKPGSLVCSAF